MFPHTASAQSAAGGHFYFASQWTFLSGCNSHFLAQPLTFKGGDA